MNDYLKLPTHKRFGWLIFLIGFFVVGFIALPFSGNEVLSFFVFGVLQWLLAIAFVIEVLAWFMGKNKPLS